MNRRVNEVLHAVSRELTTCLDRVSAAEVETLLVAIEGSKRIFLAGAGRSALGMRGFAMRLMHLGRQAFVVGETTTPGIGPGDLLVIGSGSGRTASLFAAGARANELGARVTLITIDPASPIAELAASVIKILAPSPKATLTGGLMSSIQPMGALFEQSLFLLLDSVIVLLMERGRITAEQMFTRHANLE